MPAINKLTLRTLLSTALVLGFLLLSGCGSAASLSNQSGHSAAAGTDVRTGLGQLLQTANQLNDALKQGGDKQIQSIAPKLEDTWAGFEDQVKPNYPDNYDEIEKYLDPLVAGAKSAPLNKSALGKLNQSLIQAIQDLQHKMGE